MEPVEEKLQQLEKKYRMRTLDIIRLMKERLNFYALYNLFDQVVMNKIDFYSQQQKIWIHMKNFESQIVVLQQKLNKLDNIQYLINDEDKCYILD